MYRGMIMVVSVLVSLSCTGYQNGSAAPMEHSGQELERSEEAECRANMQRIASEQVIFYAIHGFFAETQEELGLAGLHCPSCGTEYILRTDGQHYAVLCPLPQKPSHGNVVDGVASWPPEPRW